MADRDREGALARIEHEAGRIERTTPEEVDQCVKADLLALYTEIKQKKPELTLDTVERFRDTFREDRVKSLEEAATALNRLKQKALAGSADLERDLDAILLKPDADRFHNKKRAAGYIWTDHLVSECASGRCPYRDLEPSLIYALADISLEQYVRSKAALLFEAGAFHIFEDAYYEVYGQVTTVFSCPLPPKVGGEIFDIDNKELSDEINHQVQFYGGRARRAFWLYQKDMRRKDDYLDWVTSCAYVIKLVTLSAKQKPEQRDCDEFVSLIRRNFPIATTIDLYKYCHLRKKMAPGSAKQQGRRQEELLSEEQQLYC